MSMEQRINLKLLAELGKTLSESFALLQQVYKEDTMSRARTFEWHKRFREGREECEGDQRCGKPVTSRTVSNIDQWSERDHRSTGACRSAIECENDFWWNLENAQAVRKNGLKSAHPRPKRTKIHYLPRHYWTSRDGTRLAEHITGDETWIFEYDPDTKRQSREWKSPGSPRPMKAKKSKVKVMLVVFFWSSRNRSQRIPTPRPNSEPKRLQRNSLALYEIRAGQEAKSLGKQRMGAPSRQRSCPHSPECSSVSHRKEHCNSGTSFLFSRHGPCDF